MTSAPPRTPRSISKVPTTEIFSAVWLNLITVVRYSFGRFGSSWISKQASLPDEILYCFITKFCVSRVIGACACHTLRNDSLIGLMSAQRFGTFAPHCVGFEVSQRKQSEPATSGALRAAKPSVPQISIASTQLVASRAAGQDIMLLLEPRNSSSTNASEFFWRTFPDLHSGGPLFQSACPMESRLRGRLRYLVSR